MDVSTDRNLVRLDHWFASSDEVLSFLQDLFREYPHELPENVSSALLQARKNITPSGSLEPLKREIARLLALLHSYDLAA